MLNKNSPQKCGEFFVFLKKFKTDETKEAKGGTMLL
jgi:hypothetical protein